MDAKEAKELAEKSREENLFYRIREAARQGYTSVTFSHLSGSYIQLLAAKGYKIQTYAELYPTLSATASSADYIVSWED